jgi:ATP-dependent DNA helicase DinG
VRSFDPDVDEPYRDLDEAPARHVDDDIVAISADAATALLNAVTADLPGGGEVRDSQRDMVGAVAATLSRRGQLIIEAGTGVGKSLGYLVPLALSGRRAVVATATKNLQDQLASKDAPQVAAHAPGLTVSVLKGRSNYLCLLRARENAGGAQMTFDEGGEVPSGVANQMRAIIEWSSKTQTGDRDELTFDVDARAWRSLSVTPQECLGRGRCPVASACFAERARDLASESQIVIVNTALYAAHLASDERLLPEHDLVVFDEAHEIVDIFSRALGVSVSPVRLRAVATLARALLSAPESSLATDLADLADRLARELTAQFDTEQVTGLASPSPLFSARRPAP